MLHSVVHLIRTNVETNPNLQGYVFVETKKGG